MEIDYDIVYVALNHYKDEKLRLISNLEDRLAAFRNTQHGLYTKWDQQRKATIAFIPILDKQIEIARENFS